MTGNGTDDIKTGFENQKQKGVHGNIRIKVSEQPSLMSLSPSPPSFTLRHGSVIREGQTGGEGGDG